MASGSFALTRTGSTSTYITFTCNWSSTKNVTTNSSTVKVTIVASKSSSSTASTYGNFTASASVNGSSQSVGSTSFNLAPGKSLTLLSKSYTVAHNSDGTKTTTISANVGGNVMYGNGSKSVTLDTSHRGSVLGTISNFTLGNAINIPITKYSTSFTDTLTISLDGTTIKTVSGIVNGADVSFTSSELTTIYSKLPSATSGSFTFKLTTKSGSTQIGTSSKTATGTIPSSVKPTISSVTVSEGNTSVVPSSWGVYIKNKSKLKFVTSASAGSGSSISTISTVINGSTYTGATITTNLINATGNLTATITVTDKRGRTASTTKSVSIVDYDIPYVISLTAIRCDKDGNTLENGTYAKVNLVGGVSSINGKNTASYSIKYKKTTETEYQTYNFNNTNLTIDGSVILNGIETNSSYNIMAVITDYFTTLNENMNPPLMSVFRTLNFLAGGRGGAVGKMAEEEDTFEIAFQTKLTGGLKPIFLEADTDLNDVRTPNFYTGQNISNFNYGNCPLDSGTFSLEVVSMGADGQVKQKLVYCHKTEAIVYERIYYQNTWGEWVRTSDFASGKLLASPSMYMTGSHRVQLSENINKQQNGIILVFSVITGETVENSGFNSFFVHKNTVNAHNGSGHSFFMTAWSGMAYVGQKYLYINNDVIVGHDDNNKVGVVNGLTIASNRFVLRYVIGV